MSGTIRDARPSRDPALGMHGSPTTHEGFVEAIADYFDAFDRLPAEFRLTPSQWAAVQGGNFPELHADSRICGVRVTSISEPYFGIF